MAELEEVARGLLVRLGAQEPILQEMGPTVVALSPVLVVREAALVQPAAVLPAGMLARFWTDDGREVRRDPLLPRMVGSLAAGCLKMTDIARRVLEETERLYVSAEAPAKPWPDSDRRLRVASLVLADVVRKLAANVPPDELVASYGFREPKDPTRLREVIAAMQTEEAEWMAATLGSPGT